MDAKKYWAQAVIDYASTIYEININQKDIETMAEDILNDDDMWGDIEFHLNQYILSYFKKRLDYLKRKEKCCSLDKEECLEMLKLRGIDNEK